MADNLVQSDLHMDRSKPLGNVEVSNGRRALQVQTFPFGAPLPTEEYDAVTCSQVDPQTHLYEFRTGGQSGTVVQTLTIGFPTPTPILFTFVEYA